MSQRLANTKWLWYLLVLHADSFWSTAQSVTVRTPPSNPSTIEAQAKFFQDFFSVQLSPYKIEFGHVCEDPNTWEQRYEKKDFKNHRDMGKVRWGDKKGGYGEHYWDLNHAGNAGDHGDDSYDGDDGSYHESNHNDPYDDHSNSSPTYGSDDYDPEKSSYEESGRAKRRAYPKIDKSNKGERKHAKTSEKDYDEEAKPKKQNRKNKEQLQAAETSQDEEYEDEQDDEIYEQPKTKRQQHKKQDEKSEPKEKKQFVLVVSHKDDTDDQQSQTVNKNQPDTTQQYLSQPQLHLPQYLPQKSAPLQQYVPTQHLEPPQYVPYEGGAGVRQHQQPAVSAATTVPRLFLEPSTGHVVDRATGQAYVLQPIAAHNNYN